MWGDEGESVCLKADALRGSLARNKEPFDTVTNHLICLSPDHSGSSFVDID